MKLLWGYIDKVPLTLFKRNYRVLQTLPLSYLSHMITAST